MNEEKTYYTRESQRSNQMKGDKKRKKAAIGKIFTGILILLVIGMGVTIFFLVTNKDKSNNDTKEAQAIKEKVEKLMYLPDETPTLTTVENEKELQSQNFFKDVKKGDKVLIFINDAKVVIYRESENKIINVGPIVNDTVTNDTSQ